MRDPRGTPGRQDALARATERVSDDDRGDRLPEPEPEEGDGNDADEHGGEFEVGGAPGSEQLPWRTMTFGGRDSFDTAWFDGSHTGGGSSNSGHGQSLLAGAAPAIVEGPMGQLLTQDLQARPVYRASSSVMTDTKLSTSASVVSNAVIHRTSPPARSQS